jgi:hypothetical protein
VDKKQTRRISTVNLITGYICAILFLFLILLNRADETSEPIAVEIEKEELFTTVNEPDNEEVIFDGVAPNRMYTNNTYPKIISTTPRIIRDSDVIIENTLPIIDRDAVIYGHRTNRDLLIDEKIFDKEYIGNAVGHSESHIGVGSIHRDSRHVNEGGRAHGGVRTNRNLDERVDIGLLDRRLAEVGIVDNAVAVNLDTHNRTAEKDIEKIGINVDDKTLDFSGLTLARDNDDIELGDIDLNENPDNEGRKGYGVGKGGELYAYNFPSQGVGAGIGSSALGAGVGGGAGLGAGIGEGILDGEAVPTLGGVGTGTTPLAGQAAGAPPSGGVGGLVGGAGAGGAAGLTQGYVIEKLGLGMGKGCSEHGEGCEGHHGHGEHNYDHLPKDGALYIMMHVDGSGSILNTRKQLDEMKNTLLKDALLPYYNNDEQLYNRRVLIVDGNGERTLQFFTEAAAKDNVLALVFQDEAAPDYHLPTFNKNPQDHYSKDLNKLKSKLNGYGGLYRGIMFQVDRGRTFAKSFKEMVECAWRGEGYLATENLKKYYWEENPHHIRNKDGVVFSDEYHAKDSGDPQYYLDLIFEASKKVGLDLDIYGAGLKDGRHVNTAN